MKKLMTNEQIEEQSIKATKNHLINIKRLEKGKPSKKELEDMYSYLDYCWVCEREFSFWDRISFNIVHSFEGNSHKRNCIINK